MSQINEAMREVFAGPRSTTLISSFVTSPVPEKVLEPAAGRSTG